MTCGNCGRENRAESRFCDRCGSPLESRCPACGAANRADARFCHQCGAGLAADRTPGAGTEPTTTASAPGPSAERRVVTVLFTDLVGFTTFAEDRDPEAVRELLSHYFDTATAIVERHGGTVEKFIGDAVMAVWGTPIAHEDDAERAVRAALELVGAIRGLAPGLEARAGALTGEAAVTVGATNQGMVAGDLVNTAARLQGVAEPGTVLVGEATMRAAADAIVFEPLGEASLRGKAAPVAAWRAVRVVSGRGGSGRADGLEAPFVGREEELRLLKDQLHAVGREGRTRLVSISGPGGIGKSRLVWELEKYADGLSEDVYWHRGRSPSYGEGVAFWALGEMVRRRAGLTEEADDAVTRAGVRTIVEQFVPDTDERDRIEPALLSLLGLEPGPAGGRETLFPAWRRFFERVSERGTSVLVFEDLQWADSGLLDFIDHVLDWSRGLPMLVVTLARPELFDRRPDWGTGRRHLTAVALERLSDRDVRQLLEGLVPGLPDDAVATIVARSEGVPLYAVETVRALLADGRIERSGDAYRPIGKLRDLTVPESLRSLIASRLDALDPADRSLVQDAAVLGQVFQPATLAAIAGREVASVEERLRDLMRRELFDLEADPRSPERGQVRFVQALIREVAYGTLGRRERRARHLAVARHYEGTADEETAAVLASHYLAAHAASEGEEAAAIATQARLALGAAAGRAASLGAHAQAVAHLEQAIAVTADLRERAPLLERAAQHALLASQPVAEQHARAAIEAYEALGDERGRLRAASSLGKVLIGLSEIGRATEVLEAALAAAETADEPAAVADTLANLSRAYMRLGDYVRSVEAADGALAIAEREGLDVVLAEALINKGSAFGGLGRVREGTALLRAAVEVAGEVGNAGLELRAHNNLATMIAYRDPGAAALGLEVAIGVARDAGDRHMYPWLVGTLAIYRYELGSQWDEALDLCRDVLEVTNVPADRVRMLAIGSAFRAARGEPLDEFLPEIEAALGGSTDPFLRFGRLLSEAGYRMLSGEEARSFALAIEAASLPGTSQDAAVAQAVEAAALARRVDDLEVALQRIGQLPAGPQLAAVRDLAAGALAALRESRQDGLELLRRSRTAFLDVGQAFSAARVAVAAAFVLPTEPEVRGWADEARPLLVELRATAWLERLDEALRAMPVSRAGGASVAEDHWAEGVQDDRTPERRASRDPAGRN